MLRLTFCRRLIPAFSEGVACVRVCNSKLAVGSKDGVVRIIFSANTGEILHLMQGTKEEYIDRIFIDTELVISSAIPGYITADDAKHKRFAFPYDVALLCESIVNNNCNSKPLIRKMGLHCNSLLATLV